MAGRRRLGLAAPEPARDGLDDGLGGEPRDVQLGGEADLRVDDAVGGEVDDGFGGDPLERSGGLHHGQRVLERGQVLQEVAGRRRRA